MAPPTSWWRCSATRAGMREPLSASPCYQEMPRSKWKASSRSQNLRHACPMAEFDWLIERPLAHRGLQDEQTGIIENTVSAFAAAITGRYGIECDLQISADGEAMVYHDDALGRLSDGKGRLDAMTAAELKRVPFRATADRMMTLGELCDFVAGRATLLLELKSPLAADRRLAARAAKVLSRYCGQPPGISFHPSHLPTLP